MRVPLCQVRRYFREVLKLRCALNQVPHEPPPRRRFSLGRSAVEVEMDEVWGILEGLMPSDSRELYRRAELRLRELLFGDASYSPGVVKGDEQRARASAELRYMREAFDKLTQHEADLAEELLQRAQERTPQSEAARTTKRENPDMINKSAPSDRTSADEAAKFRLTFAGRSDAAATHLDRLTTFAEQMCNAGVARLKFGSGRMRPRLGLLPIDEERALIHIYNEQGRLDVYACPYRSVFERAAPSSISSVEAAAGLRIGHGNAIHDVSDRFLDALEAALREAHAGRSGAFV